MLFRLKVFLSVASNLSFTKASEELYISQPAISKHISELEKIFQVRLFNREKGRIRLTREGEIFRENALTLMEDYKKLESEMRILRGSVGGRLRLGASTTIAQWLIAPILAGFKSRFPQVEVSLVTGNTEAIEKAISENRIDLGLVEGSRHASGLRYSTFAKDELVLTTSSETICPDEISERELTSLPIVLRENGSGTLEVIKKTLEEHSIRLNDLNVVLHIGATEGIKGYLEASKGTFALLSVISIRDELRRGSLKIIDIRDLSINRDFSFVSAHGDFDAAAERFIEFATKWRNDNLKL